MNEKELGMRIKRERKVRKLTQKQLGKIVGLHHTAISRIETGKQKLGGKNLLKFLENGIIDSKVFFQYLKIRYS